MKIAIVRSTFNNKLTSEMKDYALAYAKEKGVTVTKVIDVPGAYDIPFGVKQVIEGVDGVATLGAIIKGDTDHDQVIGQCCADGLSVLSLDHDKPISLGVIGPGATKEQAQERAEEYAKRSVQTVLDLLSLRK